MSRAEDATMRLYESASIREDLTDDEAKALFSWAEDEIARIDQADVDDEAFDERVHTLMNLVKQINRYAGRQGQPSAQGVDETPQQIAGLAGDLGHAASPDQIAATSTGDPMTTVQALTSLLSQSNDQPNPEASAQAAAPTAESQPQSESVADPIPHDPLSDTPTDEQPDTQPTDQVDTAKAAADFPEYLPLNPFGDDVEEPTDQA